MSRGTALFKTSFERLADQFKAANQPFNISTRPYFSSGAFRFKVTDTVEDSAGVIRVFLKAEKNQRIEFFSYGLGDDVDSVGLGNRNATDCDTNIVEKTNTNNEDFCIEGLSATSRGIAVNYEETTGLTDETWNDALVNGTVTIDDPGANVLPPEVASPLTLEDTIFRAMAPKVQLRLEWNRKEGDYLGTVDQIPEGGGKSYLKANGEPTAFNYFRIPEGWIWRREGAPRDTILVISATVCEPILVVATLPLTFIDSPDLELDELQAVNLVWKLRLHGRAAYLPSQNV
jgi:hypothetical protein